MEYGKCENCEGDLNKKGFKGMVDGAGLTHFFCPDCYKKALSDEYGESSIIERKKTDMG